LKLKTETKTLLKIQFIVKVTFISILILILIFFKLT